jgi:hypothetical protein
MLLKDNATAWIMDSLGSYRQLHKRASSTEYIAQKELVNLLVNQ